MYSYPMNKIDGKRSHSSGCLQLSRRIASPNHVRVNLEVRAMRLKGSSLEHHGLMPRYLGRSCAEAFLMARSATYPGVCSMVLVD